MTKRLQQDISQSRYEKKKILKHENVEEVCEENKCKGMKRKARSADEPVDKS